MSAALRVIDTGLAPARRNVAMSAALAELRAADAIPDTLRFHRYEPAILVGRNQAIDAVLDRGACLRHGVAIARRITGGGAVYVTPAMLAFEFVLARNGAPSRENLAGTLCDAVAAGLSGLGVVAHHRPPNDIVVGSKKLGGAAGYDEATVTLYQGTILVDADWSVMAELLAVGEMRAAELMIGLAKSLTTLRLETGRLPMYAELTEAILGGVAATLDRSPIQAAPTPREAAFAEAFHAREYGTDAFVEVGETDSVEPPAPSRIRVLEAAR